MFPWADALGRAAQEQVRGARARPARRVGSSQRERIQSTVRRRPSTSGTGRSSPSSATARRTSRHCGTPRPAAAVQGRRRPRRGRLRRRRQPPAAGLGSTLDPGAHVVDPMRQHRGVGGGEVGGGDVAHVHEVAGLRAVAEHDRSPSGEKALAEDRHDAGVAGRVLAGAVDIAVAQGHDVAARSWSGTTRRTPRPPACSARRPTAGPRAPSPGSGWALSGCRSRRQSRCSPRVARLPRRRPRTR